ncbi:nucleotide-binding protein [Kineococcus sp. SYSU DK005]|uniref:nucleotide-binding protein n=1 Tax=Kineococcus sp. SYSU DK005 TaxID=3383126 RepID=UPI003D7EA8C1
MHEREHAQGAPTSPVQDPRTDERSEDGPVVRHRDAALSASDGGATRESVHGDDVEGVEVSSYVVHELLEGSEEVDDGTQEESSSFMGAVDAHLVEQELQQLTWPGVQQSQAPVRQLLATPQAQARTAPRGGQEPEESLVEPPITPAGNAAVDTSAEDEDFIRRYREATLRDAAPLVLADTTRPRSGWRGATARVTAGRVMPSPTRQQIEHENLLARIRRPLRDGRHIAVISFGSGVGKTVTTGLLGQVFSTVREDSVAAVDCDPVAGNLLHRFATVDNLSLQQMLQQNDRRPIQSIRQLSHYAVRSHRLHLYRADHSRAAGPFGEAEHAQALQVLMRFHDIVITDMGPGGVHEMPKAFDTVDDLVIVAGTNLDAATRSSQALDFLEELGHHDLVKRACAVMVSRSGKDSALARARRGGGVHVESLMDHFQRRCGSVVLVPYSAALADGVHVSIDTAGSDVRDAYMDAAAALAGNFQPHEHTPVPAPSIPLSAPLNVQPEPDQPRAPRAPRRHWWQRAHRPVPLSEGAVGDALPGLMELPHYGRARQP